MNMYEEMEKHIDWVATAVWLEAFMGVEVNWEEKFFICPECSEPIYESDWIDCNAWGKCPICEFDYIRAVMG